MLAKAKQLLGSVKDYVASHRVEIFFAILVFLLAFGIRGQLMVHELMFEFDSYFHAHITEYVIQNLAVPETDPIAYFQVEKGASLPVGSTFFWVFNALIYKIVALGGAYDKGLWIMMVKLLPAFYGALISVAMYFLGKEMYSRKAGIAMAIFAATIPAFVYRTMAGFFEEDALGFLWLVLGFIFFIRSVKQAEFNRQTIANSLAASFFFILMAMTWGVFLMIPLIFVAWFPTTMFLMWFKNTARQRIANVAKNFAIMFSIFVVATTIITGPTWIEQTGIYVSRHVPVSEENVKNIQEPNHDTVSVYAISVGEEQPGFRFWGNKYGALIIFPIAALLVFIPYRLFAKRDDFATPLVLFWLAVALIMAFVKLKFTYVLGLPLAAAAGITVHQLFEWTGHRHGLGKKMVSLALGFLFLTGIATGMFFVPQNFPHIEQDTGWKQSLFWIRDNTPKDAKFFNWWDEGHWITFIGERAVSTDNRNYTLQANSDMATFILSPSEEEAYEIVKSYDADYVIVSEDLLGKMHSLGLYAYNTIDRNDPRLAQFAIAAPCQRSGDALSGQAGVRCGAQLIPEQQYKQLPTQWTPNPTQQIDSRTMGFVYRNGPGNKVFLFNKQANDAFLTRLFFDEDNVEHFELVYENKEVRIFKVK